MATLIDLGSAPLPPSPTVTLSPPFAIMEQTPFTSLSQPSILACSTSSSSRNKAPALQPTLLDVRGVGVSDNEVQTVCNGNGLVVGFYMHEGVLCNNTGFALLVDTLSLEGPD